MIFILVKAKYIHKANEKNTLEDKCISSQKEKKKEVPPMVILEPSMECGYMKMPF